MADENKIVTPSDIEEAKTETVDTQTTATVENTVAEKDEKVESVIENVEGMLGSEILEEQKRFFAIKLLEKDSKIVENMTVVPNVAK